LVGVVVEVGVGVGTILFIEHKTPVSGM